jgi:osmotically-inducible protein OsmY
MRDSVLRIYHIRQSVCRLGLAGILSLAPMIILAQPAPQLPQEANTDHNAPNTKQIQDHKSTKEVSEKLEKAFEPKNAAYAGSSIKAVVDEHTLTLNGTVKDQGQHEMALQLARAYAGNRKIVDRLTIQP